MLGSLWFAEFDLLLSTRASRFRSGSDRDRDLDQNESLWISRENLSLSVDRLPFISFVWRRRLTTCGEATLGDGASHAVDTWSRRSLLVLVWLARRMPLSSACRCLLLLAVACAVFLVECYDTVFFDVDGHGC